MSIRLYKLNFLKDLSYHNVFNDLGDILSCHCRTCDHFHCTSSISQLESKFRVFKLLFCLILSNCIDWFVLIGMVRVYFGQFRSLSKIFFFLRVWHEIKLKLFRKRWFLRLEFYFFIYLLISCRKHIRTAQTCFFITVKWQFVCVLFHSSFFPYICQIAAFLFI